MPNKSVYRDCFRKKSDIIYSLILSLLGLLFFVTMSFKTCFFYKNLAECFS